MQETRNKKQETKERLDFFAACLPTEGRSAYRQALLLCERKKIEPVSAAANGRELTMTCINWHYAFFAYCFSTLISVL